MSVAAASRPRKFLRRLAAAGILLVAISGARTEDALAPEIETVAAAAGEVLAISDLCQWDLAPKIEKLFQNGAPKVRMSQRQQQDIRAKVTEAQNATFGGLSPAGRARMKVDICKPAEREYLEKMIAGMSFD